MPLLRLATRRSKLALAQARAYVRELCSHHPDLRIEELHVVTSGDRIQDRPLQDVGGKGLFIKEVEEALLDGRADIAVHSIKDVPADLAPGLAMAAIPLREDPRDVLVLSNDLLAQGVGGVQSLPEGCRIGTSSLRRKTALHGLRSDLDIRSLRGNVDTRLAKLDRGEADAIVLAAAGLRRLGMDLGARGIALEPEVMLPAVGQGALGIECRAEDTVVNGILAVTNHHETNVRVACERAFMAAVGGSCHLPVAAYSLREDDSFWVRAMLADEDGSNARSAERRVPWPDVSGAEAVGHELGEALR